VTAAVYVPLYAPVAVATAVFWVVVAFREARRRRGRGR
jgi:hypothetical protein